MVAASAIAIRFDIRLLRFRPPRKARQFAKSPARNAGLPTHY
jgi:hypothetical protein